MLRFVVSVLVNLVLVVPRAMARCAFALRRPRILKFELAGPIVWRASRRRFFAPRRDEVALDRLDEEWDAIAIDPRVHAVIVVVRNVRGGFVAAAALYERLRKLREKKRVVVFAAHLGNRDLVIASGATSVVMPPSARIHLTGIGVEVTHLRGLLDHASVRVDVDAAGKYKGALERFTRSDLSEPQREVLDAILDSWSGDFVARISEGRRRTGDEVTAWIAHGPYTADAAREAGLIDDVAYEEDVATRIDAEKKTRVVERARARSPVVPRVWPAARPHEAIAVVTMKGLIHMGASRSFPFFTAGDATVRAALKRARENKRVRGVLLAIDSGGGSALASDLICDEVARTRREKPVVAWMGNVATSGGYYVAAPANEIVASPFTLTGSIGVISGRFVLAELFRRWGVTRTLVARGRFTELDAVGQPLSDEARALVQAEVADCYERFLARVAEGRRLPIEDVRGLAEGRVYTGRAAAGLRLVDHLGDWAFAVERARVLAHSARARLVPFEPAGSLVARGSRAALWAALEPLGDSGVAAAALFLSAAVFGDGAPLAVSPDVYAPR